DPRALLLEPHAHHAIADLRLPDLERELRERRSDFGVLRRELDQPQKLGRWVLRGGVHPSKGRTRSPGAQGGGWPAVGLPELADLFVRWLHLIAGIMWIGNSLLFNWLDRNLVRPPAKPAIDGEIWLLHSGGFYEVEKKMLAPNELPAQLHWFKWQNAFTW